VRARRAVEHAREVLRAEADTVAEVREPVHRWRRGARFTRPAFSALLLLALDDLAALLRAVVLAELDPALALAGIHAGARVAGAGALALPLARVDTGAVDHVAAGLLIGARQHGSAEHQRRRRARDEDSLRRSHSPS